MIPREVVDNYKAVSGDTQRELQKATYPERGIGMHVLVRVTNDTA